MQSSSRRTRWGGGGGGWFCSNSAKDVAENEGSNKIKDSASDREAANDTQSSHEFAVTGKHVSSAHDACEC
jgi:hypothetical protein